MSCHPSHSNCIWSTSPCKASLHRSWQQFAVVHRGLGSESSAFLGFRVKLRLTFLSVFLHADPHLYSKVNRLLNICCTLGTVAVQICSIFPSLQATTNPQLRNSRKLTLQLGTVQNLVNFFPVRKTLQRVVSVTIISCSPFGCIVHKQCTT